MLRNMEHNLPTLDLHGEDRIHAVMLVEEFLNDQYSLHNEYLRIVHGIGSGILRREVTAYLKKHPLVVDVHLDMFNEGCTNVKIKKG